MRFEDRRLLFDERAHTRGLLASPPSGEVGLDRDQPPARRAVRLEPVAVNEVVRVVVRIGSDRLLERGVRSLVHPQSSKENVFFSLPGPGAIVKSIPYVRLPTRAEKWTFTGSSAACGSVSFTSTMYFPRGGSLPSK